MFQKFNVAPHCVVAAIGVALCMPNAALAQERDWLAEAVAATQTMKRPTEWAYEVTTNSKIMDEPRTTARLTYDPSLPEDQQWKTLSSTDPENKDGVIELADFVDPPIYADLADLVAANAQLVSQTDLTATYKMIPKDGENFIFEGMNLDIELDGDDITELMEATIVVHKKTSDSVETPYISSVDIGQKEPAGGGLAKIRKLQISLAFAPQTDAATGLMEYLPTRFAYSFDMRLFYLMNINVDNRSEYSGYRYVGEKADETEL